MNTLPDILHCMSSATNGTEMSVFERQRARMKWQQDRSHHRFNTREEFTAKSWPFFSGPNIVAGVLIL